MSQPSNTTLLTSAPVFVHRLARLIHASFRPRLAAIALASSLDLHLHQVGQRTFTSELPNMPGTQRSRCRAGRYALAFPTRSAHTKVRDKGDTYDPIKKADAGGTPAS